MLTPAEFGFVSKTEVCIKTVILVPTLVQFAL